MMKITVSGGPALAKALQNKSQRVKDVLLVRLNQLLVQLESKVKGKLSGQVLKVQTGILRSSVHSIPATISESKIRGSVEAAGGPAFYGRIHEHGGGRAYQVFSVNARALSYIRDGRRVFAASVQHPPLVARPFMSTALAEEETRIRQELDAAIQKVIHED